MEQVTYQTYIWQKVKHLEEQWPSHEAFWENGQGVKTKDKFSSPLDRILAKHPPPPSPFPPSLGVATFSLLGQSCFVQKFLQRSSLMLMFFYFIFICLRHMSLVTLCSYQSSLRVKPWPPRGTRWSFHQIHSLHYRPLWSRELSLILTQVTLEGKRLGCYGLR